MMMVREPSLVSATFLVICGSPWNGAFLEEVDAEPPVSWWIARHTHQRWGRLRSKATMVFARDWVTSTANTRDVPRFGALLWR